MKPINIQTVDAEIERLEQATTLTPREEFHLGVFRKMFDYLSAEPVKYLMYHISPDNKKTLVSIVDFRPEFVDPSEGFEYVALIERP